MTKLQKQQIEDTAILNIEKARGKEVAVNIVKVARSGASRQMKFYIDGFIDITEAVADLTGNSFSCVNGAMTVRGGGMDMVFSVLSNLNYKMAQVDTGKTIQELLKTGECGVRIYDNYFVNADKYTTL